MTRGCPREVKDGKTCDIKGRLHREEITTRPIKLSTERVTSKLYLQPTVKLNVITRVVLNSQIVATLPEETT